MSRNYVFLSISIALYVLALSLPAANRYIGFECLVAGWFSLGAGVGFGWLANPLMAIAWIGLVSKSATTVLLCSAIATVLMLSTLANPRMVESTSGDASTIVHFGPGFWLWLASAISLVVSAVATMSASPSKAAAAARKDRPHQPGDAAKHESQLRK